jgi:hypothetical protein
MTALAASGTEAAAEPWRDPSRPVTERDVVQCGKHLRPANLLRQLVRKVLVEIERLVLPRLAAAEHTQPSEQRRRPLRPRGTDHDPCRLSATQSELFGSVPPGNGATDTPVEPAPPMAQLPGRKCPRM